MTEGRAEAPSTIEVHSSLQGCNQHPLVALSGGCLDTQHAAHAAVCVLSPGVQPGVAGNAAALSWETFPNEGIAFASSTLFAK